MRPYSHHTNYQRVVVSSANDVFFTYQNFLNCDPGLQFNVRWQNPLFLDIYPSSGYLILGIWPIIRKIAYLRCEQEGENIKWVITKLSPFVCFWVFFVLGKRQTLSFVAVQTGPNASRVPATVTLNLYKTQFCRIMWETPWRHCEEEPITRF